METDFESLNEDEREPESAGMNRKSLLRRAGAVAVAAGTTGVWGVAGAGAASEATNSGDATTFPINPKAWPKNKTVGLLAPPPQYDIDHRMIVEAQNLAKQAGWKAPLVDVTQSDANAALKTWANQKVDGVISLFIPATIFGAGFAAINAAKIPVGGVIAGYTQQLTYDVQGNEWVAGAQVAAYGLGRLGGISPGPGGAKGAIAAFAVPAAIHQGIRLRQLKSMASFCPQVKIVAEPGLNTNDLVGDTKAKVQALLRQYPKGKLDWIWVADSTLAIPAAQALQAAGRDKDVFITGHNGILQEFDYIRAGGPCKACTYNSVEYYTAVAMQTMANLFRGVQPIAHTIYCSTPFINKRNVPPKGKYPPTPYVLASSNTKI